MVAAVESIPGPDEVKAAVLNAIERGSDYHTCKEVNRLLLDGVLVSHLGIGGAARDRAALHYEAALTEFADPILADWSTALEPHAQALLAAARELPTHNLDNTQTIVAAGATAMAHWASAQGSLKLWRAAVDGFMAFAMTAHISATKRDPLIVTPADTATLGAAESTARREGAPIDVWMLARHRAPLRLATLTDYMQRSASLEQQQQAAARAHEEQHEQANRRRRSHEDTHPPRPGLSARDVVARFAVRSHVACTRPHTVGHGRDSGSAMPNPHPGALTPQNTIAAPRPVGGLSHTEQKFPATSHRPESSSRPRGSRVKNTRRCSVLSSTVGAQSAERD